MNKIDSIKYTARYDSPLGGITLGSDGEVLLGLWFDQQKYFPASLPEPGTPEELPVFAQTARWLTIYFSGREPDFTPPLRMNGSAFRQAVWQVLRTIPYGQTMTYGEIAGRLAAERGLIRMSAQAVGGAVGHNPLSLIIPCHRVVGADGSLTGYAGGLEKKAWLLAREGVKINSLRVRQQQ